MRRYLSLDVPHMMVVAIFILLAQLLTAPCDAGCPFSKMNSIENSENDFSERQSNPTVVACQQLISEPKSCDPSSPYRTADGTCNNLRNPTWGAANTTLKRMMPNYYSDGLGQPYRGVSGNGLPNTRLVSITVDTNEPICLDYAINNAFWIYGQFLAHDMVDSFVNRGINCTGNSNTEICLSIQVPQEDTFNRELGVTELSVIRFTPPCNRDVFDPKKERLLVNRQTHYLDCSHVYGENNDKQNSVRTFKEGKMKVDPEFTKLMPVIQRSGGPVFFGADVRATQNPGLSSMTSVLIILHNRLCDLLRGVNPDWDDNRLYQEAKRITCAIHQSISYGEFLPLLLGPDRMRELDLNLPSCTTEFTKYDPGFQTATYIEAACGAYRMHTGPPDNLDLEGRSPSPLKDNFNTCQLLTSERDAVTRLLKGSSEECGFNVDRFVTDALTNHALQARNASSGFDMAALNMRRGEDCGIPPYLVVRSFFGSEMPNDFNSLGRIWRDPNAAQLVEKLYKGKMFDIHAWLGMLMEPHVPKGVTGQTSSHIIGRQFQAMKKGDRFFVTHRDQAGSFTKCQLKAIRSTMLSHVLCLAMPDIKSVPERAFQHLRPYIDCNKVTFDISPWKEFSDGYHQDCDVGCRPNSLTASANQGSASESGNKPDPKSILDFTLLSPDDNKGVLDFVLAVGKVSGTY